MEVLTVSNIPKNLSDEIPLQIAFVIVLVDPWMGQRDLVNDHNNFSWCLQARSWTHEDLQISTYTP